MSEQSVIVGRQGRVGHILLNRPRALNALDLPMIRAIADALAGWRDDPSVHAVMIEGAGERAFCAGGDIKGMRQLATDGDDATIETFFREEYALNAAIAAYPKPYIALIDGICMGGGVGVSVHGRVRVATEHGLFAMPETGIAMFPDIGATFLLPRLPGALGMYLGLTGARMTGPDAVHAGLATHFVPRADLPALRTAVMADGVAVVATFARALAPFSLRADRPEIDHCFGADSVAEIVARLEISGSEWARTALSALRAGSPSAVLWSFAMIRRGATLELGPALDAELRMTRHVTRHREFSEGVRAALVDKDRTPQWEPARIEDVDLARIERMLA